MTDSSRIVVNLEDVHRLAREVVETTPAARIAEALVERLRAMHGEGVSREIRPPREATRASVRAKLRRYGV